MKMNFKISMVLTFLLVSFLTLCGFLLVNWQISLSVKENISTRDKDFPHYSEIMEYDTNINKQVAQLRGLVLYQDLKFANEFAATAKSSSELLGKLEASVADPGVRATLANMRALDSKNEQEFLKLKQLVQENKMQEALQHADDVLRPINDELSRDTLKFKKLGYDDIQASLQRSIDVSKKVEFISYIVSFSMLVISMIIGVVFATRISNVLNKVVTVAHEVASGNLLVVADVGKRSDEIGDLANAINKMVDNLKDVLTKIQKSAETLASSSEELTASSDQATEAAQQIAQSIVNVSQSADIQLQSSKDSIAVVAEVSQEVENLKTNAVEINHEVKNATQCAHDGNSSVNQVVEQMSNIEKTVLTSANIVKELGDRSKTVGQIVEAISGIAAQTNLLALNAAIEAARAGEQGRGFAVVAEEVRKLAEQSSNEADSISQIVKQIQTDTERAVVAMANGTKEVALGSEVVHKAGETFKEIDRMVSIINEKMQSTQKAVDSLVDGNKLIVAAANKASELSKENLQEAENVSASAEEQSATMEELNASSQVLSNLAEEMRETVAHFRM